MSFIYVLSPNYRGGDDSGSFRGEKNAVAIVAEGGPNGGSFDLSDYWG
jgi:hypothetical protein